MEIMPNFSIKNLYCKGWEQAIESAQVLKFIFKRGNDNDSIYCNSFILGQISINFIVQLNLKKYLDEKSE